MEVDGWNQRRDVARALDFSDPGGAAATTTTSHFRDKPNSKPWRYLAAELVSYLSCEVPKESTLRMVVRSGA
jgi:hypothetical protein